MTNTNEFFIASARAQCEMSIKNTGVGKWLGRALDRLDKAEAEIERLRERATALSKLCSDRLAQRWDDNSEYRAEIQRLREALDEPSLAHGCHNCPDGPQPAVIWYEAHNNSYKPGDGDSIWVEVLEHDGKHTHIDYAVVWLDVDGLRIRRFEQNSPLFCQPWPPDDVLRWCRCEMPQVEGGGDDE